MPALRKSADACIFTGDLNLQTHSSCVRSGNNIYNEGSLTSEICQLFPFYKNRLVKSLSLGKFPIRSDTDSLSKIGPAKIRPDRKAPG
jgi:hypothetical protein